MPARASEPPEGISTVVSARRTFRPGTVVPDTVTEFSGASSDTSVNTLRLMRPSDSTTGVNVRLTPKLCQSIPTVPPNWGGVGKGNLPPARKLAFSPEIAVRVGSANVRVTPARSIARKVAVADLQLPATLVLV